jgi:tetraacyldisaccharide 4'-kinase
MTVVGDRVGGETRVRRMWRGQGGLAGALLSALLLPLSAAYRVVVTLRGLAYGLGLASTSPPVIPVVSVGNVTVGGTGKTPVTRWIVNRLRDEGRRPAVVLRGYGSDEVLLHAHWAPDVPVVADADRVAAVVGAARAGADVAVVDDGFQHRRLGRDLDIVLLAAEERFPGPVLPRGPYREPAGAVDRADVVVVTRKSASPSDAEAIERDLRRMGVRRPVVHVRLRPGRLRTLADWSGSGDAGADMASAPEGPFRVVCGVADPDSVVAAALELGLEVADRVDFPDHHEFTVEEAARLREGPYPLVITEKDAIKLRTHAADARDILVIEQELVVERGEDVLRSLLSDLPGARAR